MDIRYANNKVEKQCTDLKAATRFFGGDKNMAISIMSRINAIEQAIVIKDIIVMPTFRFHQLKGKRKGYFAIDVKTIRDKWRIIVQPLDDEGKIFDPCNIDEVASIVKIIEISEVSAHYE